MGQIRRPPLPDFVDKMRRCDGKEKLDRANAESRAAGFRKRERDDKCEAYECPYCKGWHVGHKRQGPR